MQIVVNISHNLYESLLKDYDLSKLGDYELYKSVKNGTPLPEKYGRLGDLDAIEEKLLFIMEGDKRTFSNQNTDDGLYYDGVYAALKIIRQIPTIIPATKNTEKELAESIIALIPHLPTESDKARMQTATKEKSCLNCSYYPNTAPYDSCDGYSNYNEWQTTTEGDK